MESVTEKSIYRIFIATLILKALNAILEIIAGILFLFTGTITWALIFLTQSEISEDPTDIFANFVRSFIPHSSHSQLFAAAYLLIHGIAKILVVIGLFSRRIWAYKLAECALFAFICFQLYEYAHTGSWWLIALSIFDTALLWLTWREHQKMKMRYTDSLTTPS
jgi:uncharacterized membrane protein